MIKPLCLLLLVASANCFYIANETDTREKIVGGRYIDVTKAPYLAQVIRYGTQICGASIISKEWLVSAAHCFEFTDGISIITGSTMQGQGGEKHKVANILVNRNYDAVTTDFDIALIKLAKPITFNKAQQPIPITDVPPKRGEKVKVCGFGKIGENLADSLILRGGSISVLDIDYCQDRYDTQNIGLTDNMFCGTTRSTDTCQGDSGGPGVINGKLAGIVSFGIDCGSKYYPGIYTNVYKFRTWITRKTGLKI